MQEASIPEAKMTPISQDTSLFLSSEDPGGAPHEISNKSQGCHTPFQAKVLLVPNQCCDVMDLMGGELGPFANINQAMRQENSLQV